MTPAAGCGSGVNRAFVAAVFVLGVAALGDALCSLHRAPVSYLWIILAVLTIGSDALAAKYEKYLTIPGLVAHVSPSEIFLFLLILLFGGAPAVATVALGGLAFRLARERQRDRSSPWHADKEKALAHAAFNLAEPALSVWVASRCYVWSGGPVPLGASGASVADVAFPALAMAVAYFVMNGGLNAVAEATSTKQPPLVLWRKYLRDVSVNYFSNASIAVVLAVNLTTAGASAGLRVLVVVAPLVLTPYSSLWLSRRRLEDQAAYVKKMEELQERLVETLGMTAEAQNPGRSLSHIRRVRKAAVRLARQMGISDPREQRAIAFAGLLHDFGKLKVPEHIQKKPGKLTPDEYEIMKTHTTLGADMVSRIGFDLPLAPLIRHHHENWDGAGYPDGLRGEAIPIGARILSVVDCYDALRERRPYRLGMTHDEAMAIVRERAGTMYDPAVVRAFEAIKDDVRHEPYDAEDAESADAPPSAPASAVPEADDVRPRPIELRLSDTATLVQLHRALTCLAPAAGVSETCEIVARHLLKLAPAGLVVFYRRDEAADQMIAVYASGFGEALARGVRIPIGQKPTGWVAARGQSLLNGDPSLDLEDRLDGLEPKFRSLLSLPLKLGGTTLGVVTLYSLRSRAFREEQRQAIELVSDAVAAAFDRAVRTERSRSRRRDAGAPCPSGAGTFCDLLAADEGDEPGRTRAVLFVKCAGDEALMLQAKMAVGRATRVADLIYSPSESALVVLMRDSDPSAGALVSARVASELPADIVPPSDPDSLLRVGFASSPHDGLRWKELVGAAERRAASPAPPDFAPAPASADADERGAQ